MRLNRLNKLDRIPLTGVWYRALRLKYWKTRLSSEQSRFHASRFNAASLVSPSFRILHLAETHQVALHESRALVGDPKMPIANPKGAWVILPIHVRLDNIVDLTSITQQRRIETNHSELTGNWTNTTSQIPTQNLGHTLYEQADVEGFLYKSAIVNALCLAVFPDRLGSRSSIMFFNELTSRNERLK